MEKLKKRWGISSNWQVLVIFIVFGITGSSSVLVAEPILGGIGFDRTDFSESFLLGGLWYYLLRLLIIFPLYQVLLVMYGWLFGQFRFFFNFEKNMLSRMGLLRVRK